MKNSMYSNRSYDNLAILANQFPKEKEFWKNKLSGELSNCSFIPHIYNKSLEQRFDHYEFSISGDIFNKLVKISGSSDINLHVILLAEVSLLLFKYTQNNDVRVGSPIYSKEMNQDFVNTVVVHRNVFDSKDTIKNLFKSFQETAKEAINNANYPFEKLVEDICSKSELSEFYLFEVAIVLENIQIKEHLKGVNNNVNFIFFRTNNEIRCTIEFNETVYKKEFIKRLSEQFINIVVSTLIDLNRIINDVTIISNVEKTEILIDFNQTVIDYPNTKTVIQLFEEQVKRTPYKIALIHQDKILSYKELNERADAVAFSLKKMGLKPNEIVAVMLEKGLDIIVSIYGILKAKCVYLPIDISNPKDRVLLMIKDSCVSVIITIDEIVSKHLNLREEPSICEDQSLGTVFVRDRVLFNKVEKKSVSILRISCSCDVSIKSQEEHEITNLNLVYSIYTSGSTGRPKSSMVYHNSFTNLVHWYITKLSINENDRINLVTSLSFDLTQKNIFAPLIVGGTLHITEMSYFDPQNIADEIQKQDITILNCTPSMISGIISCDCTKNVNSLRSLKYLVLGGEPIIMAELLPLTESKRFKGKIVNTYGPTECTDISNCFIIDDPQKVLNVSVPIGKPINNVELFILDNEMNILPVGVPGELCISGISIGTGYINNPDLTNLKFVINPFDKTKILYKTGDLVKWLPDGNVEFIGRKDEQVKIRGARIELGEIEKKILDIKKIKETVVIVRAEDKKGKALYAYVVLHDNECISVSEIKKNLSVFLPNYMIPEYFIFLDKIPLSPNGKINKQELPDPVIKIDDLYVATENELEKTIESIWKDVLLIGEVGISINANFFDIGGHSLNAMIMISKLHNKLGVKITLIDFFRNPTIKQLAQLVLNINIQEIPDQKDVFKEIII